MPRSSRLLSAARRCRPGVAIAAVALPNESGWQSQISALPAEGGDVSISFGGYTVDTDGDDLGAQCSSASAMSGQVESVVTTLNVTHLDFDLESNEETSADSHSPADNSTYVAGDEVSYNARNWTANQWNYDEVPGGASGAWDNDGAC